MSPRDGTLQLVEVQLVNTPTSLMQRSSEHHDELFREFRLVLADRVRDETDVPARLLDLITRVQTEYGDFTRRPHAEIQAAAVRGIESIDVIFRVPPSVHDASERLLTLLEEADVYCRRGELLTLASPPDVAALRRWYLTEFVRQIDGGPPIPWQA